MSEENVEVVRRAYEGGIFLANATSERWDRAFREYLDEEFELRLPDYPEGEPVFRGRQGVEKYIGTLREVWREYRFEPERFLDRSDRALTGAQLAHRHHRRGLAILRLNRPLSVKAHPFEPAATYQRPP